MLVFAAIGVFGAGMLAIAAGIPIKDFGYGNTLILSGVMAWCTSAVMLTLWACFRDLKQGIFQPGARPAEPAASQVEPRPVAAAPAPAPATPPGWPESIPERSASQPAPAAPPPPEVREPRRNLLFASNRRPSRESSASPSPATPEAPMSQSPAAAPLDLRPTTAIEEPRPAPRRIESPPPRPVRPISTVGPRDPVSAPPLPPAPPPAPVEPPPPPREPESVRSALAPNPAPQRNDASVTVLKSGVVDGMAYWLYSDGSIEAQMPEGMMRFTSIDELRAHLDKRT